MTPPICKVCGKAHWARDPHPGMEKPLAAAIAKVATIKPKPKKKAKRK